MTLIIKFAMINLTNLGIALVPALHYATKLAVLHFFRENSCIHWL
jgi:hypothetical protein